MKRLRVVRPVDHDDSQFPQMFVADSLVLVMKFLEDTHTLETPGIEKCLEILDLGRNKLAGNQEEPGSLDARELFGCTLEAMQGFDLICAPQGLFCKVQPLFIPADYNHDSVIRDSSFFVFLVHFQKLPQLAVNSTRLRQISGL